MKIVIENARQRLCRHSGCVQGDKVCTAYGASFGVEDINEERALDVRSAEFAVAFAKALPGLYRREHDKSDADYCEARNRDPGATFQPPMPEVCTCGADEVNAALDELADKLGIPPEARRQ